MSARGSGRRTTALGGADCGGSNVGCGFDRTYNNVVVDVGEAVRGRDTFVCNVGADCRAYVVFSSVDAKGSWTASSSKAEVNGAKPNQKATKGISTIIAIYLDKRLCIFLQR